MRKRFQPKDPFSGFSHLTGAVLGVAALIALILLARGKPWHVSAFAIYGASLILLYTASAVYHLIPACPRRTKQLQIFDHIGIYLLIAGTYTPVCLIPLRGSLGWSLFGIVWGIAVTGIAIECAWRSAPRWLGLSLYLVMGWLALVAISPLKHTLSPIAVGWLAAGGLLYTVGAVIFALERPRLWPGIFGAHDLWHVFVLGGSACHFMLMLQVVPFP